MNEINQLYTLLLKTYGRQGWWPVYNSRKKTSEYGTGAPKDDNEKFEIIIGAILTQNVAWKNVEKALGALKAEGILTPRKLHKTANEIIAPLIRPAGYYNQKTLKIKNFLDWFKGFRYSFDEIEKFRTPELRRMLLEISGVGPETADSILLYALNRKIFVIDAYTKRIFSRLNLVSADDDYHSVQEIFHNEFTGTVKKYSEYHALIVAHGKDICRNRPSCADCCLKNTCFYFSVTGENN